MERKSMSSYTLILAIIGLWTIIPQVQVDMIYRLIILLCLVISLLRSMSRGTGKDSFSALAIGLLFLAIDFFKGGVSRILLNFATYFMLILVVVFCSLRDRKDFMVSNRLYILSVFFCTVFNLRTIIAILMNNTIIRTMVLDSEGSKTLLKSGIGGFGLVFSQTILIWCSLFLVLYTQMKIWKRIILVAHIISAAVLITYAQFMVGVISLIVGVIALILNQNRFNKGIKRVILLLGIIVVFLNIENILTFLYLHSGGTVYQEKILQFIHFFSGEELTGDSAARVSVYGSSINIFLKSPLIGTIFNQTSGGHSTLLDILAKYGVLVGIPLILLLFLPIRFIMNMNRIYGQLDSVLICFQAVILSSSLVSLLLDPMGYHYWFSWYILLPIAYSTLLYSRTEIQS